MNPNDLILSSSNWDEYFARLSALEKAKEKGDAFERFTQLYLQTAPKYRLLLKNVWKPDQDFGIDFLARTHQDQLCSIQSKFRSDSDSALTYKELSTFKTLSDNTENIDFCLVVHTSTKPIKNLHLLGENISTLGIDEFESIDHELWGSIQSAARGEQKQLQPLTPRPHQQQAVEDIKEYFSLPLRTRGRVSMPCGSGKSLVGFWSAQELDSQSTVIVVPSLYLINQSIRVWSREILANQIDADFLVVCSDETTKELNTDDLGGRVDELGVQVAQSVEDIKGFLTKQRTKQRIIFITYQSGTKLIEASSEVGFVFDLTILDEAHKTVGYRTKSFARLIVDEKYISRRYLFMTATERVLRGKNDEILSMADSEDYGELIHQLSFRACVEADPPIISDYRVVTLATSDSRVKEFIENNPKVFAAGGEFDDAEFRDVAACLMLREFYKDFETERTISFHSSIKKAERFLLLYEKINEILGYTDIAIFHISSKQSTGVRARQVHDFTRAQKSHISNARCLTEGIDIPSVDAVLFADPKYSVVDIVQAAGRALRLYEGKKLGYIFLPILLPDGVEFEEYSASSEYKQILRVIAALANQDERIVEQFQVPLLETDKPDKDKTKVVDFISYQITIDPEQLRQQIEVSISSFVGRKNYRSFEEAREYIKKLRLKTHLDYKNWARSSNRPTDIPGKPERIYKLSGWVSWPNWLGTEVSYLPFEDARALVHGLNFKNRGEYMAWANSSKRPLNIPKSSSTFYKLLGWVSWGDWLGTNRVANQDMEYRRFGEARKFIQSLGFTKRRDYWDWAKSEAKPEDIPAAPQTVYEGVGWISWGDWLGTRRNKSKYWRNFSEARKFVHELNFENRDAFNTWAKSIFKPEDIPATPSQVYKKSGWVSWGDWLGTGYVAAKNRKYQNFNEARAHIRALNFSNKEAYVRWAKSGERPLDIPADPSKSYLNEWTSWPDWLGKGLKHLKNRNWRNFERARELIHSLKFKNQSEYNHWSANGNRPMDVPAHPPKVYKYKGWISWPDWLGTVKDK